MHRATCSSRESIFSALLLCLVISFQNFFCLYLLTEEDDTRPASDFKVNAGTLLRLRRSFPRRSTDPTQTIRLWQLSLYSGPSSQILPLWQLGNSQVLGTENRRDKNG